MKTQGSETDGPVQADEYPAYLEAFETGDERSTRLKIQELEAEIESLRRSLDDVRRGKRILYAREPDLVADVMRFLADELHVPVGRAQGSDSFVLLDGQNPWCLGEVRGPENGNVTKEHLAHLMISRGQAGKPDDWPALLVVNTFAAGRTLEDRDLPVPAEIAKRAEEDHIVVMRTIDVVRLWQRATNGLPAVEPLTEALRAGGGWFRVDDSLRAGLYRPDEALPAPVPAQ